MRLGFTDVHPACRTIRRRPALAAAIVLPIALAIAVNTALFSVMDGLLFRPLPFERPDDLVAIEYRRVGDALPEIAFLPWFAAEREQIRASVESTPLLAAVAQAGITSSFPAERDSGIQVTGVDSRFFPLLGLTPMLGANFTAEDEVSPALAPTSSLPLPVIISHGLWQRLFGGDPHVLGVHDLAGRRVRVAGVMGRDVRFPGETDVWVPIRTAPNRLPAYGRLAPGAAVAQVAGVFPQLHIIPLSVAIRPDGGRTLIVLFGATCLLLLVAWVQVAALAFAGTISRVHELGVRLALGAARLRLAREFVAENTLLAGAAFVIAWLSVRPLTAFVVSTLPSNLTRGQYLTPDARTFIFACLASLLGLALLTALPVGVIRNASPLHLLQHSVGHRLPVRAERVRNALLVVQVTLTTLLLYVAGVLVHSFVQAATYDYGFDSKHVLVFTPPMPPVPPGADLTKYGGPDPILEARAREKARRVQESIDSLRGVPGVVASASFFRLPLVSRDAWLLTTQPGVPDPSWDEIFEFGGRPVSIRAHNNIATAEFVRALGATVIAGRSFDDSEYSGRLDVAVVNETLARLLSPPIRVDDQEMHHNLIGSAISIRNERRQARIIGVIKDLVYSTPAEPSTPQFYLPTRQRAMSGILAIRTAPSVDAALPTVRAALQRVWETDLPLRHFTRLQDAWHVGLRPIRDKALLVTLVAAFCLPLAAIGLSGALLYSVQVRTRETAIRIALGAEPRMVRRAVVLRAVTIVALGILLGTVLGIAAGRVASHQLFNVHPADPWTMASVAIGLLALAWVAALLPAHRASRSAPAALLRHE